MSEGMNRANEQHNAFIIERTGYDPLKEQENETLFTLANGYVGIRGSIELPSLGRTPETYFAGLYDKHDIEEDTNTYGLEIINKARTPAYAIAPNWNLIEIYIEGKSVDFINCSVMGADRKLDMRRGTIESEYELKDIAGRITRINTCFALSRYNQHISICKVKVTPQNYSKDICVKFVNRLELRPGYIGRLRDYISMSRLEKVYVEDGFACMEVKVSETGQTVKLFTRTLSSEDPAFEIRENGMSEGFLLHAKEKETYAFCKQAVFSTSLDAEKIEERKLIQETIKNEKWFLENNIRQWNDLWALSDIKVEGNPLLQKGLRWCLFNLNQLADREVKDVSISATGLHGQGYFGHVFWDTEIFMLPYYLAIDTEIARNLLRYRYDRMDAARTNARKEGSAGAKFPWTSTWKGYDVTPPDWERAAKRQIHISADIAYAFRMYLDWTGDTTFFENYGIELMVETAKFYISRMERDEKGKYHLYDVIGPDEYNIHANDNYYTNFIVKWNIAQAIDCMDKIKISSSNLYEAICKKTGWDWEMKDRFADVGSNLAFPMTRAKVNEQYEGYFKLSDIPEIVRDEFFMPVKKVQKYGEGTQMLKQPDVVMMHYLFPGAFDEAIKRESFLYYEKRCNHGSSLSASIHSVCAARLGYVEKAYRYFCLAALLDLKNLHIDSNMKEGIHAACAGGAWIAAIYGMGGITAANGELRIEPVLPKDLTELSFAFKFRGRLFRIRVNHQKLRIRLQGERIQLRVYGSVVTLEPGESIFSTKQKSNED